MPHVVVPQSPQGETTGAESPPQTAPLAVPPSSPIRHMRQANQSARAPRGRVLDALCVLTTTWNPLTPLTPRRHMPQANQLHVRREDVSVTRADLLDVRGLLSGGGITERGLRDNLSVGLAYMESWLRGVGCVPIHNLMEDAATAEISRCGCGCVGLWVRVRSCAVSLFPNPAACRVAPWTVKCLP